MQNLALESTGAHVVQSSSWDTRHPPDAIIDGQSSTFWATTGNFPQELVITFDSIVQLSAIDTRTLNVKGMKLFRSVAQAPSDFNEICTTVLEDSEADKLVSTKHKISDTAVRHLKLMITSGFDDFTAVYQLAAKGENLELSLNMNWSFQGELDAVQLLQTKISQQVQTSAEKEKGTSARLYPADEVLPDNCAHMPSECKSYKDKWGDWPTDYEAKQIQKQIWKDQRIADAKVAKAAKAARKVAKAAAREKYLKKSKAERAAEEAAIRQAALDSGFGFWEKKEKYTVSPYAQGGGGHSQPLHSPDYREYVTLDSAKAGCIAAGDCSAIDNGFSGGFRIIHGDPTFVVQKNAYGFQYDAWRLIEV